MLFYLTGVIFQHIHMYILWTRKFINATPQRLKPCRHKPLYTEIYEERSKMIGNFFQHVKYYQKSGVLRGAYLKNLSNRQCNSVWPIYCFHFFWIPNTIFICLFRNLEAGNLFFSIALVPGILFFWVWKWEIPEYNTGSKQWKRRKTYFQGACVIIQ